MGGCPGAYAYDANGNLSKDLNRGISNIRYNILNLPAEITFTNGNKIRHYYDAYGVRYHTATITNQATATLTASKMAADAPLASGSAYQTHQYFIGNCVYWQTPTGQIVLNKVLNPMGYVSLTEDDLTYNYYAKDYLGNVKEVYSIAGANATTASCIQRMQYYPSGLPWENNFGANLQPYKYGGKEFVEMHSLDEYDSEARWYYPALMCTTTMDPLCEKYYSTSPYAWCGNNPVNIIDPDGRNPIYDLEGNFLGVDDLGLQGEAIFMQSSLFSNGMDNIDAVRQNVGMDNLSPQARETFQNHYANLCKRPDWDGVVTASEGIAWAWQHPDALQYPTADNMLYINTALLDFGNITTSDCTYGVGAVSAINLLNKDNLINALTNPALRNTVYALGCVDVQLINAAGLIQVVNNNATDYDWNKGGGAFRNSLIQLELLRTQLPQGSGFKTFYYGYGSIRTK